MPTNKKCKNKSMKNLTKLEKALANKEREIINIKKKMDRPGVSFNDMRTDKSKPLPTEVLEVMEMFKNGAFKTCDGKKLMINRELAMVYDLCLKEMNGMNMKWFNNAEKWVDTQMERGLDTFDKMKCYWTRVGSKKKNDIWYGSTHLNRIPDGGTCGMCVMAGAMMGVPVKEWASERDPLDMD